MSLNQYQVDCGENALISRESPNCCGLIGLKNHCIASLSGDCLASSLVGLLKTRSLAEVALFMAGLVGADLLVFISGICTTGWVGLSGTIGPLDR